MKFAILCAVFTFISVSANAITPAIVNTQTQESTLEDYYNCMFEAGYLGLTRSEAWSKCGPLKPVSFQPVSTIDVNQLNRYYQCFFDAGAQGLSRSQALALCGHLKPAGMTAQNQKKNLVVPVSFSANEVSASR